MRVSQEAIAYAELFILALMLIVAVDANYVFSFFTSTAALFSMLLAIFFFAYFFLYITKPEAIYKKGTKKIPSVMHVMFALALLSLAAEISSNLPAVPGIFGRELLFLIIVLEFLVLFIPVFFFIFMGAELVRSGRTSLKVAAPLFVVAFLFLVIYFPSHVLFHGYNTNDEEFLAFSSVNLTLHGVNPYTVDVAQQIFNNATTIGPSVTTYNKIVGVIDYPALFFLVFFPFYFLSPPTVSNLGSVDLLWQATVFLFVLIVVIAFSLDRRDLLKPRLALLVFLVISSIDIVSITTFLMLALFILAYMKLESKYGWLLLGMCAALQEELWVPVLLLILYSLNNMGFRKGLKNAVGAFAVFLAINSYFLATAPSAFIQAVILPIRQLYLPNGAAPVGFVMLQSYPLQLSTYYTLFDIAIVAAVVVLLYFNRKMLVPLLSILPFMVWDHALPEYYVFFVFILFFLAVAPKHKDSEGWFRKTLGNSAKPVFYAILLIVFMLSLYLIYESHLAYVRNFSISSSNESLVLEPASNASIYRADLRYGTLSNYTIYLYAIAYGDKKLTVPGLYNQTLINASPPSCGAYECLLNRNKIVLPSNESEYELKARIPWTNATPVNYVVALFYNGEYYFISPSVYNASACKTFPDLRC
ncbi:MAG: hypothetical protein KGH57_00635 [Candidatus Micrarchaeota archaeon]|nr:hypothetical protein [Candidatus Micrarchaeota archaeon]